jgi:hypothetical protein
MIRRIASGTARLLLLTQQRGLTHTLLENNPIRSTQTDRFDGSTARSKVFALMASKQL